jgi:hypothetical protein
LGTLTRSTAYSDKYDAAALVGVGCLETSNKFHKDTKNPPDGLHRQAHRTTLFCV